MAKAKASARADERQDIEPEPANREFTRKPTARAAASQTRRPKGEEPGEDPTKADITRANIIKTALRLSKTKGLTAITLRDIATASGMKAGSIYYHFESKDDLIRAALKDGVGRGMAALNKAMDALGSDSSPLDRLEAALRIHLHMSTREPFAQRVFALRQLPKPLREEQLEQERQYAAIFGRLFDEGEAQGLWRPDFDLKVVRYLVLGSLIWVGTWYNPKGPLTLDQIIDQVMALLRDGLLRKPA
ncbi:MAG: TetR/AcrR family transcriptional regulator [Phenylobacterium sp.]|uniref:TetR/AcrR family transcriptional regulator n=1 Tax=Phenylobacterium sp. TaxID=1871053 RepID=UPI0027323435|nr:TetR/AcrR family transcriptional regulator [Phenylobacterium sp.]MDP3175768.1 TetR/AcrR family transcriptional regulator [Phenylobacterium sp.]